MTTRAIAVVCAVALAGPTVTAASAEPAPVPLGTADQVVETPVADDPLAGNDVLVSTVRLHYPSPYSTMAHPAACDWISYLRFRHKDGPTQSRDADAIYIGQPGTLTGASTYRAQAPQVIHKAAAQGKHVEYLALERRANCLEDHTGYEAARRTGTIQTGLDYYYRGKEVNGRTYHRYQPQELGFLGEYGLALTLDDWRAVITHAAPDPAQRRKVLCGGHSLGGYLVGPMLAWDFDKNTQTQDDAGYNLCGGGAYALEGIAFTDPLGLHSAPLLDSLIAAFGNNILRATANTAFRNGLLPTIDTPFFSAPELGPLLGLAGEASARAPHAESTLLRDAPRTSSIDLPLRLFLSPHYIDLINPLYDPRRYRLTNRATLGVLLDNNAQWLSALQTGMGALDGPVTAKTFPAPNDLDRIPFLGPLFRIPQVGIGFGQNYAPADRNRLHDWIDYDRIPAGGLHNPANPNGNPVTTPDKEVTSSTDMSEMFAGTGSADMVEWYFPTRILSDTVFALGLGRGDELEQLKYRSGGILDFLLRGGTWQSTPTGTRLLTVIAGDGPNQNVGIGGLIPNNALRPAGYRHFDAVTAAAKQNNGRPEPVSTALVDLAFPPDVTR
nr:hypothetical protein [Kibdelosporangium sp. MJ126-NF4]CEL19788.1 FIG00863064: hypothetical protein [Kibdelosporangium sp. MJ126-NF4]CTQ97013.1 FIG00863064: hypothetical protein [Kibdelosporangium sp. MJ126-NF4]